MAHGGDQVRLGVIQQPEARHVVKHDRDADERVLLVAHRQHARQKKFFLPVQPEGHDLLEAVRQKTLPPSASALRAISCKGAGSSSFNSSAPRQFRRRQVLQINVSLAVQHENRDPETR